MRLAAALSFAALTLSASSALAQSSQPNAAVVVPTCGTLPTTYVAGLTFALTQDPLGNLCSGTQQQNLALVANNASAGSFTATGGDYLVNVECSSYGSAGGVVIQQLEPDGSTYQPLVAYTQTPAVAGVYTAGAVTSSVNLPVTGVISGAVAIGQTITGTGISGTVTITAFQSGVNGGAGTYTMSSAQTIAAGTIITAVGTPVGITLGGNAVVRAQLGTGTIGCILNLVRVP